MATTPPVTPVAAPVSAPSTPTPAAAPSTPVTPTPTPTPTPAPAQDRSLEDRVGERWAQIKETVTEDSPEAPAVAEPETPEAPAVEEPAADPDAPAAAAPEGEQAETPAEEEPGFEIELPPSDDFGPQQLATKLGESPEAKAFFDANPELKNAVFGALRRDTENRQIREYVPNVEVAKQLTQSASTFLALDNAFLQADTKEGAQSFTNMLVQEALIVGEDGKPVLGADGKMQVHSALPAWFDHIFDNKTSVIADTIAKTGRLPEQLRPIVDALGKFAKLQSDERLETVAEILKEAITPSSSASGEIPDELKPYAESLKTKETEIKAKEDALSRQERERQVAADQESVDRAMDKVNTSVDSQLKKLFATHKLTEFESTAAQEHIERGIAEKLGIRNPDGSWQKGGNRFFQSSMDALLQRAPGPEREKSISKLMLDYTQQVIGPIAAEVVRNAKAGVLERQQEKQGKVAAQQHESRTEPKGASVTPASPQSMTPTSVRAQVISEYKASHGGEEPDQPTLVGLMWKATQKPAAKR